MFLRSCVVGVFVLLTACSGGGGGGTAGGGTGGTAGGAGAAGSGSSGGAGTAGFGNAGGTGVSAGGSGSNAGGTGSQAAVGTILRIGMQSKAFAMGPDGAAHVIFEEGYAERIFYGRCTASCANESSWAFVRLLTQAEIGASVIGVKGLEVDATGRVHALVGGVAPIGSGNFDPVVYLSCASNCGVAASWSGAHLGPLLREGATSVISGLTVAADGTIGVIGRGDSGNYDAYFATCSSNCTVNTNWAAGPAVRGTVFYLRRDAAGVSHILFSQGTTAQGDNLHFYGRCASNCTVKANWQLTPLGFVTAHGNYQAGFTVTPSGRVFLAYNQGN
ncbi:MAG: hypothetical protein JNK82_18890, partial [Myxococcaceae bacterium]|nr:hypothetical protein [Myxococcaceae bacterium]